MGPSRQTAPTLAAPASVPAPQASTRTPSVSTHQPQGNAAAQLDPSSAPAQASAPIPEVGDDIRQNGDRLTLALPFILSLFETTSADLESAFADQVRTILAASPDAALASLFGQAAGTAAKALLGAAVTAAGGPVAARIAGAVAGGWAERLSSELTRCADPSHPLDDKAVHAFFRSYGESWHQAVLAANDRVIASGDPVALRQVTEATLYLAYHPAETEAAMRAGMIVPLLQACDRAGAGRRLADGQLTGMYNLEVVYTVDPDGGPGRLTRIGLPVGVPEGERDVLLDLADILDQLPCQLVSDDGRLVADIAVHQVPHSSHVDPTLVPALEAFGSGVGPRALDDLRYQQATGRGRPGGAESNLDDFVDQAVALHWDELRLAAAGRSLRDLQSAGVQLLGAP